MKKTNWRFAVMLVATAVFGFFACNKEGTTENKQVSAEKAVEKNKIDMLAQRYTQPIDQSYPALQEEFAALTEAELKAFYLAIYKINNPGTATISEEQFIKQFEKYFSDSKAKYNRPFNKLSLNEMANIISPPETNRLNQNRVIPPDENPDPNCPYLPYPEYFYWAADPNAPYSPPFASWRLVDFYDGDCDGYELTYNGYWGRLRALTPHGAQAIALFLQGDHITGKTRVLHKKSSADGWFGNVYLINDHIRMATDAVE
jgi:hypothetical protein